MQSAFEADWRTLEALPNYLQRPAESKSVRLEELVESGSRYRFRLQANPTVTRQGKRYGLLTEPEQLAWLGRQGERHGFVVPAALVSGSDLVASQKEGGVISVRRVCYEGVLEVQQLDAFSRALTAGIGPAKAFGCGLLSVAR
ncbi:CRISPR-associated endoribonuclease Cse3 [compost metagenome]